MESKTGPTDVENSRKGKSKSRNESRDLIVNAAYIRFYCKIIKNKDENYIKNLIFYKNDTLNTKSWSEEPRKWVAPLQPPNNKLFEYIVMLYFLSEKFEFYYYPARYESDFCNQFQNRDSKTLLPCFPTTSQNMGYTDNNALLDIDFTSFPEGADFVQTKIHPYCLGVDIKIKGAKNLNKITDLRKIPQFDYADSIRAIDKIYTILEHKKAKIYFFQFMGLYQETSPAQNIYIDIQKLYKIKIDKDVAKECIPEYNKPEKKEGIFKWLLYNKFIFIIGHKKKLSQKTEEELLNNLFPEKMEEFKIASTNGASKTRIQTLKTELNKAFKESNDPGIKIATYSIDNMCNLLNEAVTDNQSDRGLYILAKRIIKKRVLGGTLAEIVEREHNIFKTISIRLNVNDSSESLKDKLMVGINQLNDLMTTTASDGTKKPGPIKVRLNELQRNPQAQYNFKNDIFKNKKIGWYHETGQRGQENAFSEPPSYLKCHLPKTKKQMNNVKELLFINESTARSVIVTYLEGREEFDYNNKETQMTKYMKFYRKYSAATSATTKIMEKNPIVLNDIKNALEVKRNSQSKMSKEIKNLEELHKLLVRVRDDTENKRRLSPKEKTDADNQKKTEEGGGKILKGGNRNEDHILILKIYISIILLDIDDLFELDLENYYLENYENHAIWATMSNLAYFINSTNSNNFQKFDFNELYNHWAATEKSAFKILLLDPFKVLVSKYNGLIGDCLKSIKKINETTLEAEEAEEAEEPEEAEEAEEPEEAEEAETLSPTRLRPISDTPRARRQIPREEKWDETAVNWKDRGGVDFLANSEGTPGGGRRKKRTRKKRKKKKNSRRKRRK